MIPQNLDGIISPKFVIKFDTKSPVMLDLGAAALPLHPSLEEVIPEAVSLPPGTLTLFQHEFLDESIRASIRDNPQTLKPIRGASTRSYPKREPSLKRTRALPSLIPDIKTGNLLFNYTYLTSHSF